jgi:DNA-binding NarL/FixJ family response regulator
MKREGPENSAKQCIAVSVNAHFVLKLDSRPAAALSGDSMRILIVDDHPVVISGCRALLAGEADVEIFAAADAEKGFAGFVEHRPEVCLIDLNLPGQSGFELTRRILREDEAARIVIFSMNEEPAFVARAIEAGAKGYIAKNDDPMLFVGALRQVAAGGTYLPAHLAKEAVFARFNDPLAGLSPREMEILRRLAAGDALPEIAEKLGVSQKTIANNCTALKIKLGARNSMDFMRMALGALSQQPKS